jgi:histidinol phosphatase-like PHP family hydrolase
LRGDLHTHSTWTDGHASIEQMARSAEKYGLEYFALTDHSPRLKMVHGLDPARLREQWREIDSVRARVPGVKLLREIEVDILDDGALDLSQDILALPGLGGCLGPLETRSGTGRHDCTVDSCNQESAG